MKIGVRAHDYGKQEIEHLAKTLHDCGYECTQLAVTRAIVGIESYEDVKSEHLVRIREAFEKYHVEIPVFSCYMDLGNPKEDIRRYAVDTLKKCLVYGKEVGAKVVGTETSYSWLDAEQKKIWYPFMLDSLKEVIEEAARVDMRLALETVHVHPLDSLEAVLDVFGKINDEKYLRIILDASNVLKASYSDQQETFWEEWLEAVGKYIEAVHMKDMYFNEKGQNVYTALGQGVIRYDIIAKWLHANKPDMYLLREEMKPETAEADIAFMKRL